MLTQKAQRVVVVGGGAAGFFAATTCAQTNPDAQVTIYETSANPLAKVRISGGGRCNVTHACYDPNKLVEHYPRGSRELRSAFHKWQPRDTVSWFEARGVPLKVEADGRIFPAADDSIKIVDCLQRAAYDAGVELRLRLGVRTVERIDGGDSQFRVTLTDGSITECDRVLIATGGNRSSVGLAIAERFGHTIETPVPSLFTFHIDAPLIDGLSGISIPNVSLSVPQQKSLRSEGALLITHWGLSGPAVLKLSAWGAREFAACDYQFPLCANFAPAYPREALQSELAKLRTSQPKRHIDRVNPFGLPSRFWERLVKVCSVPEGQTWASLSNAQRDSLTEALCATKLTVRGKSMNKEEFVTCGGVRLREVDFKTMESRLYPGLHFAGEVLDIDGITGGFNFQAAWTTGYLAGKGICKG